MEDNLYRMQPQWKTTSMEENLKGRQPKWETEDINWTGTQWMMTTIEDNLYERQPQWKTTSMWENMEVDPKEALQEDHIS